MNNDIYFDLFTGDDILFDNILIHQPTFREIRKIGIQQYNQIMTPYTLTLDCFDGLKGDNLNLFSDILIRDNQILSCLAASLEILTSPSEILLHDNNLELVFKNENENKSFILSDDNFRDFSNVVLKINANKRIEVEKPPEGMSERQKDIWFKLQEGRKRASKRDEVHLYDILNVCEFAGKYHIPISEMMDWTLWRIMNCYKSILNIKTYDDNLKICLMSGDGKTISGKNHWRKQIMIRE